MTTSPSPPRTCLQAAEACSWRCPTCNRSISFIFIFVGISRWEPRSRKHRGLDARFKVLMKVGSIQAGGLIRTTEWEENRLIEWTSEQGVDFRGRWVVLPAFGPAVAGALGRSVQV